ncbi:MAG: NYN domain-containing protein [Bacteroidetes bacterium]|nr:NYN domain-containing protein [Bacteroidota bacterium]
MKQESPDRSRCRVRIFLDYWNYELLMRAVDEAFSTDWVKIGPALAEAAAEIVKSVSPPEYQGLNIYGSYGPTEQGRKRNQWLTNFIGTRPGISVHMVPRQKKKSPPKCPACYEPVKLCPQCSQDMRGTQEKGIDVRMATDMIKLAWVDNYDVAVLISSDRDFVPVAEFLETRGIKVVHGAFPPKGHHLSSCCWGQIDIADLRHKFHYQK